MIKLLARLDSELVPFGAHMQTQGPVRLSDNDEPEPDGAVVRGDPRDYADRIPSSADVECIIEVADSSLEYDRSTKALIYARAGVEQYVIVNLREGCLEVSERAVGGRYLQTSVVSVGAIALRVPGSQRLQVVATRLLP